MLSTVESKVVAGAGGAGVGSTLATLIVWGLDRWLLDGSGPQTLPVPVLQAVWYLTPLACAAVAGYLAPHTARPDLAGRHEQPRQTIAERRALAHEE